MTEDLPLLIKNPSPELPRAPLKSEVKHFKIWRGDLIIPAWNGWALSSSTWTLGVILSSAAITQITFTCVFAICFFVFTAVLPSWPPVYVASASTSALTTCELLGMPRQWRLQTGAPPPPPITHHPLQVAPLQCATTEELLRPFAMLKRSDGGASHSCVGPGTWFSDSDHNTTTTSSTIFRDVSGIQWKKYWMHDLL